jgi:CubicO group peptidase (beta-lactamase class C family)
MSRLHHRLLSFVLACCLASVAVATAQSLPTAPPEALGFSPDRLARLDAVVAKYVADQKIPGVVTLIMRDGRIAHLKSHGYADVEQKTPLTPAHLFRLASMSKAVTSVAVMMLVEEGAITLSDPVSKFLPSFKQTYVVVPPPPGAPANAALGQVPARRQITIRDLLTHTAGISYGSGALEAKYKAANTLSWYCADHDETLAEWIDRIATLPFEAQPGERYVYGFNTDILGRVVEVASGLPLDQFFKTRIFDPLKMPDSFFYVPQDKASRLAKVYGIGSKGTIELGAPKGQIGQGDYVEGPRKCFSGGAGLVATVYDYARFLQMLLNGGELDGARVLSPASVKSMASNHVGTLYREGALGFGLGFEVIDQVGKADRLGAAGEFSWGSAYYSRFFVDPEHKVVAIFMTQLLPATGVDLQPKFNNLVYQAIVGDAKPAAPAGKGKTN